MTTLIMTWILAGSGTALQQKTKTRCDYWVHIMMCLGFMCDEDMSRVT